MLITLTASHLLTITMFQIIAHRKINGATIQQK